MESIKIDISYDEHRRLRELANHHKISAQKAVEQMVKNALLHYDLELREFERLDV